MKVQLREFEFDVQGDPEFWQGVSQWEPETFDIVKRYADPGKSFIDIGAWNGVVSLYASHLFNNVLAIEPDVVAFDKLARNVLLNPCFNVMCRSLAISNQNGHAVLHQSKPGDSMSSLVNRENEDTFPITGSQGVETRTFETLIDSSVPIGLIKMDIEGGEVLAIPQMMDYLEKHKPPIYISFHPFWFDQEIKGHTILWLAEALFGAYLVVRDGQFNPVTVDEFIGGLHTNSFSYIFDTN